MRVALRGPLFLGLRVYPRRALHAPSVCSAVDAGAAPLSATQQQQVEAYLDALFEWNQRMNLTGRGQSLSSFCIPSPAARPGSAIARL